MLRALKPIVVAIGVLLFSQGLQIDVPAGAKPQAAADKHVHFSIRSVKSGDWSDPGTWKPARIPKTGDRVLISRGTEVKYDVANKDVIRLLQIVGTLRFARDRNTALNVGLVKVQNSDTCSESGFACDFHSVNKSGEPTARPKGEMPLLEIGTTENPIPPKFTARIRLHFLDGMSRNDAPAIACCSARMEIHGAPMNRTWVELGRDAKPGDATVVLSQTVTGWKPGDEVIVTGAKRKYGGGTATEKRTIKKIDGKTLTLNAPLKNEHYGSGEFTSEVANLSRNVIIESADPDGMRGHTVFHRFSRGGISYARFAHLGKKGVLGRYPIHFHLCGDTMRGSSVVGAAIVDSHNRWVTIHGTQYLIVRDCVGYQSVGHGFFMEDGTEMYNILDRNLGVGARRGKRLPKQVLNFDPNDGAGFWWANGVNTLVRNVSCENDHYGYRYDMQKNSRFDSALPLRFSGGKTKIVDVRTLPIWRFEDNEAHTEGLYGMLVAANGNSQPDSPIRSKAMLDRINRIDWTGPDRNHPHVIRNLTIWESHYAFRPHSPSMLMENVRIHKAAYGIYRPAFDNQVYRNLNISSVGPEPFNRGMDDASAQNGSVTVDGLIVDDLQGGNQRHPFVHMTDNNLTGKAECHFRDVVLKSKKGRRPLFNLGGSVRVDPFLDKGVPYYIHNYFGPGRHAKIVSTRAKDLLKDGNNYRKLPPLTGDESVVAEVKNVKFPKLLDPVDDLAPATIVTSVQRTGGKLIVKGVSHDNGDIASITVNGKKAKVTGTHCGVVDWQIEIPRAKEVIAFAADRAGNVEKRAHRLNVGGTLRVGRLDPERIRSAVETSIALIEKSCYGYREHRQCFSCHHQAMPTIALTTAKRRGFRVDEKNLKLQLEWTIEHLKRNQKGYLQGKGQGGAADTAGYALWTLDEGEWEADETTDAVIEYLLRRNSNLDYWRRVSRRPPSEASDFTTTYVALRAFDFLATKRKSNVSPPAKRKR